MSDEESLNSVRKHLDFVMDNEELKNISLAQLHESRQSWLKIKDHNS